MSQRLNKMAPQAASLRRRTVNAGLVAHVLLLGISDPVAAGPLDDAAVADKRGDYRTEFRLLQPLAEQGNAQAQYMLGELYAIGKGVPQDYLEAAKWFREAAEQGFLDAQDSLARAYFNGWGVPKDYVQVHMWANLAASQFSGAPGDNVEAGLRDNIAAEMSAAQIAEAQKLARQWKPK